ncbi:MAG: restriction endonuclease [bacterium]|nr:restriction endonuclease [bacterium]MDE2875401.1 restriction endonuclease [Gemmatimonadota bacterium]
MAESTKTGPQASARRVRVPWFPTYREVRGLLAVWPGHSRTDITKLHRTIMGLTGKPGDQVDWRDPDSWIPKRLSGDQRSLAYAIWTESGKTANPRHTAGSWSLVRHYELIKEDTDGNLQLTDRGRSFLNHRLGEAESILDTQEGLVELLAIVADSGPAQVRDFEEAWTEYLKRHSRFQAPSTIRDTLRRRLNNLLDRGLIDRERAKYTVTDDGLRYLEHAAPEPGPRQMIQKLAKEQKAAVRESLRKHLLQMDPNGFEELVGRLLEEMNYERVDVIGQSGDGGVDVVADIQLGVTSVREVVQAKRHKRTIQRKDLDALRGSLYRFNAVRGTIVATSRFAKGAVEAAFARGAAPITLIDGDRLIDLLIEHGIGVRTRAIEVLTFDPEGLSPHED